MLPVPRLLQHQVCRVLSSFAQSSCVPGELVQLCTALVPAALPGSRKALCWRASAPGRGSLGNQESHTSVSPQVSAELLMPPGEFIFLYQLV